MNSIKVCEYSRSRSFHDDLILQDQASGERFQDQWSSGYFVSFPICHSYTNLHLFVSKISQELLNLEFLKFGTKLGYVVVLCI